MNGVASSRILELDSTAKRETVPAAPSPSLADLVPLEELPPPARPPTFLWPHLEPFDPEPPAPHGHRPLESPSPRKLYLGNQAPIRLDPEFQDYYLQLTPDACAMLTTSFLLRGCPEPLIVWPCAGHLVLLTGYDRYPILHQKNIRYPIVLCIGSA